MLAKSSEVFNLFSYSLAQNPPVIKIGLYGVIESQLCEKLKLISFSILKQSRTSLRYANARRR